MGRFHGSGLHEFHKDTNFTPVFVFYVWFRGKKKRNKRKKKKKRKEKLKEIKIDFKLINYFYI